MLDAILEGNLPARLTPTNASVLFEWYRNGNLSAVFLGNTTDTNFLPSTLTSVGDVWEVNATPKKLVKNYDVSNASFVDNFSTSSQDSIPLEIEFNNDGTKLYMIGHCPPVPAE